MTKKVTIYCKWNVINGEDGTGEQDVWWLQVARELKTNRGTSGRRLRGRADAEQGTSGGWCFCLNTFFLIWHVHFSILLVDTIDHVHISFTAYLEVTYTQRSRCTHVKQVLFFFSKYFVLFFLKCAVRLLRYCKQPLWFKLGSICDAQI